MTNPKQSDNTEELEKLELHLEETITKHGENRESVGELCIQLGELLMHSGSYPKNKTKLEQAKSYFERALAINKSLYGSEHTRVAAMLGKIGIICAMMEDWDTSKALYERALAIEEATYGRNHPEIALRLWDLAGTLWFLEDMTGAKAAYEQALSIHEAVFGPYHGAVAQDVYFLACWYMETGDLLQAKSYFERSLDILEKLPPPPMQDFIRGVTLLLDQVEYKLGK